MTTFITAGASQTGLALAKLLRAAQLPVLVGSRSSGRGIPPTQTWVPFNWDDLSTFPNPFNHGGPSGNGNDSRPDIQSVFLVISSEMDPTPQVAPFVDMAVERRVKRFVMVGASDVPKGGLNIGKVHEYLENKGVEFVVLRPTWFMDNFARTQLDNIREHNEIRTPTPTARVPWVSVEDIAQEAFNAITRPAPIPAPDEDYEGATAPVLVGPELLSNDQVAEILSDVLGRHITHRVISTEEVMKQYEGFGIPPDSEIAKWLLDIEQGLERGEAERLLALPDTKKRVGKVRLRDWAERNKAVWTKQ